MLKECEIINDALTNNNKDKISDRMIIIALLS